MSSEYYNEELLRKVDINKYLNDPNMVNFLMKRFSNSINNDTTINREELICVTAIDHYMAKLMLNGKSTNNNFLGIYLDEIRKELHDCPIFYLSLPISNLPTEIVSRYIPELGNIILKINNIRKKCEDTYLKLNNHQSVNSEDFKDLILYFTFTVKKENDSLKKAQAKLVKILINEYDELDALTATFILKYLGYEKTKEKGLDSTEILVGGLEDKCDGFSIGKEIIINKQNIKSITFKDNIYASHSGQIKDGIVLMHTLYHELNHQLDSKLCDEKKVSDRSLYYATYRIISSYYDEDDYMRNYNCYEIEKNANIFAWEDILVFMKKYMPDYNNPEAFNNIYKYMNDEIYLKKFKNKKNSQNELIFSGDYLISILDKVIPRHPKILVHYPQLLNFYNRKGTPKNFLDLLSFDKIYECENIYQDIMMYRYRSNLGSYDQLKLLTEQQQYKILQSIKGLLIQIQNNTIETIQFIDYKGGLEIFPPHVLSNFDLNYKFYKMFINYIRDLFNYFLNLYPELRNSSSAENIEECYNIAEKYLEIYNDRRNKIDLNNQSQVGGLNGR